MIGVVPEGGYENILAVEGVTWCVLLSPQDDVSALHAITVDLRANISEEWERKLAQFALNNLPVYHSKHLLESLTGKVELEHLSENNFGSLSPLRAYMSVKHVFDALAALVGLVLLVPVFLAIAIVIRLDSPGPVLFRQMRIGYQGRPFKVFKFRTMTHKPNLDAEDMLDAAKTKTDDQRVTKSGVFLRQSRLDELPQLLNVLKGEMTLIGPRPEADVLSLWYEKKIPFYPYRHIVRPGITGWAQVNQGHVAEVEEVKSKLHFDFYYIKHFSPWIDLLIIVRTIKTVLTGFGAK
jgi:lipopolysaccharide/colanic/teichoic acid biosynthesis glycosyltransferase